MLPLIILFLHLLFEMFRPSSAHGMTTFQCPNGFFLSRFSSAYDGVERFYKFGCSKFSLPASLQAFEETCTVTEAVSTENGDLYLDCPSADQYTVGVELLEDVGRMGVDTWQLLCCQSATIQVRKNACIDTKFINDVRRPSTFSSSAQIIRRWQAMQEESDSRWWLQLCPVDVKEEGGTTPSTSEPRFRRQVPWTWTRRRFPLKVESYNPIFSAQLTQGEGEIQADNELNNGVRRLHDQASHFVGNHLPSPPPTTTTSTTTTQSTTAVPDPPMKLTTADSKFGDGKWASPYRSRLAKLKDHSTTAPNSSPSVIATTLPPIAQSSTRSPDEVLEAAAYYDMYDGEDVTTQGDGKGNTKPTRRKERRGEARSLLSGVSELLQNLQDSFMLAQAAWPAQAPSASSNPAPVGNKNFHLRIAITPPPDELNNFMFAHDDSPATGPFVQRNEESERASSNPLRPTEKDHQPSSSKTKQGKKEKHKEVNSIEGMLQMIGLCQPREDL